MDTLFLLVSALIFLIGLFFWLKARRLRGSAAAYKEALATNQIRLDRQTSQFNILTKALPQLQSTLAASQNADAWKTLCLDEARALVRADGASYWLYQEAEQAMTLNLNRGLDESGNGAEVMEVVKSRAPVLKSDENSHRSVLIVPFFMGGNLRGAFRLVRSNPEKLTTRDGEVVDVFLRQIALSLDNREMIYNREKFYLELVQTLADVIDSRDAATEGQTRRARRLARATARELSLPEEFIYYLEFAALMHDIGKIAIDESLLKKPGKLTPEEFAVIKKHPEFGHRILAPVSMLAPVAPMVLYHQEWYNGKGYPEGLSGEEIPLGARIVSILDAWGAMTSSHPWRPALSTEEAIKELRRGAGTQFDPKVVEAFVTAVEKQGHPA
jgi:HD-GYP domain-containing protein (c-di-GMP phosphodiesterase class II)